MQSIKDRAASPNQYDLPDTGWSSVGQDIKSPTRAHFWAYIQELYPDFNNKNVLDIGSGSGWLLHEVSKMGAANVLGVEPSVSNYDLALTSYPDVETVNIPLEDLDVSLKFDLMFGIMSFTHIKDVALAFNKLKGLSNPESEIVIIVPDPEYYRLPRKNYQVLIEELGEEGYVIQIKRPHGTIADIVRSAEFYTKIASASGFIFVEDVPISPIQNNSDGTYEVIAGKVGLHLLRYRLSDIE